MLYQEVKNSMLRLLRSFRIKSITKDEVTLIRKYLTKEEQILFYRQSFIDQTHALRTLKKVMNQVQSSSRRHQVTALYKACLLHDIGKIEGVFPRRMRIGIILIKLLIPFLAHYLSKKGEKEYTEKKRPEKSFAYNYYVYINHATLGTQLLEEWGTPAEVREIILQSDKEFSINEKIDATLLRTADK
ncbi:hypothetical protein ACFL56_00760 [Candidatus Margulisiibacteriota bacterium]